MRPTTRTPEPVDLDAGRALPPQARRTTQKPSGKTTQQPGQVETGTKARPRPETPATPIAVAVGEDRSKTPAQGSSFALATPQEKVTRPTQPPLPEKAPREETLDDHIDVSVHFESTFIGRAPSPQTKRVLKNQPLSLSGAIVKRDGQVPAEETESTEILPLPTPDKATELAPPPLDHTDEATEPSQPIEATEITAAPDNDPLNLEEESTEPTEILPLSGQETAPPPALDERTQPLETPMEAQYQVAEDAPAPLLPLEPDHFSENSQPSELQTPVTVHRQVTVARTWRRVAACLVDFAAVGLLIAVYLGVAISRLPDTVGPARGTGFDRLIDASLVYSDATVPAVGVFVVLFVLYQTIFIALLGQTPGLMLLRLQVISTNKRQVGFFAALARSLAAIIGLLPLAIGWSMIFLDTKHRTLHDRLSHTLVGSAVDELVVFSTEPSSDQATFS